MTKARAERLKLAREAAGLKQRDVASKYKIESSTVSRWECGALPSLERIEQLAELYGVRAAWITHGDGAMRPRRRPVAA